jgi:hypothetical protein
MSFGPQDGSFVSVSTVSRWDGMGQYMHMKANRGRLQVEERVGPVKSNIFEGCTVWLTGRTASAESSELTDWSLLNMVTEHGGKFEAFANSSKVTHIVTRNLASGNKQWRSLLARKDRSVKIVTPEWISCSVAAGSRLPEDNFKILQESDTSNLKKWLCGQPGTVTARNKTSSVEETVNLLSDGDEDDVEFPKLRPELIHIVQIVQKLSRDPVKVALELHGVPVQELREVMKFLEASGRSLWAHVLSEVIEFFNSTDVSCA